MGFRFWRRVRIAPGVFLNLSGGGASVSFGPRGAKLTIGRRGVRATAGIPGTGLYYTTKVGGSRKRARKTPKPETKPPTDPAEALKLGFFDRLFTSKTDEALIDGCRELHLGHHRKALEHFRSAPDLPDAAFLAGFMALRLKMPAIAAQHLERALREPGKLGQRLRKYGIRATFELPITSELVATVEVNRRGAHLGAVEAYQALGRTEEALRHLEALRRLEPDDLVVRVSLAELLLETHPDDRRVCRRVVRLASDVDNEGPVHAALLLYKARALRRLGLLDAAKDTAAAGLRRKKGRSAELLRALRYERALAWEGLGRHRQARADLEAIFSEDPDYEDVAERLGLA